MSITEKEIESQVRELLKNNTVTGHNKQLNKDYHYMKPSSNVYHYQYFWDTCFHVNIMVALGMPEMAKKCIKSLFALQRADGFVGHMLFWKSRLPGRITDIFQTRFKAKKFFKPHMSSLIQPPLAAQAVQDIFEADGDLGFIKGFLPALKKYYKWLAENRDFDDTGMISIISYFESGMDWKPSYDEVLGMKPQKASMKLFWKVVGNDFRNFLCGYDFEKIQKRNEFVVKDAGFNTIYIENLKVMAKLCKLADDEEAGYFQSKADKAVDSLIKLCYDKEDKAFYDIYGKSHKKLKTLTPTIFFPLTLKEIPNELADEMIKKHLLNEHEFAVRFPIPSVAINHPSFNPEQSIFIWRGPTWIVYSWFLHRCLIEKGFVQEAGLLVEDTKKLIQQSGYREYYHPFTGKGYGAKHFTWSGLLVDMIKMKHDKTN